MIQRINLAISKFRVWIFIVAALYKFTFWIIDMVTMFRLSGGSGVYTMFNGLFGMVIDLIILAVILEVSRKIAEKYSQADFAATFSPMPNFVAPQVPPVQPQMKAAPQAPAPAPAPVQPQAPAQPAAAGVWYCSGCGTQNSGEAMFCANCGKPK